MTQPTLEYLCSFYVNIGEPLVVGQTPRGLRRVVPILGGNIEGPSFRGRVLAGGADWQFVREDGTVEVEAHYQLQTEDGTLIYFKNTGLRVPDSTQPEQYYFRTIPKFEAPVESHYNWLNHRLFISKAIRNPDQVIVEIWIVL